MEKIILVDADGVITDWDFAFNIWVSRHGFARVDDFKYDITRRYGMTRSAADVLVKQFNESASIGFLPALRDSAFYVKRLHEEHGYKFHLITSLGMDENARELRRMNVKKLFGESTFTKFIFLDTGAPKDEVLEQYRDKGYYWVEDKYKNALAGYNVGLVPLLMEHGHNLNFSDPNVTVVKNWKHIYNIITGEAV